MDFARRQLEKYGWSDGKGLGKHENGISEALKPKLKRSVTGIGHDATAEFNEHWWSALYDKAAKNVEVKEKNGKTRKINRVDDGDFTITNSTWRINKKRKNASDKNVYSEYFLRKAVLTNDGTKIENVTDSETDDDGQKRDVFKMTDEELFAACEGRTAHKGARHGLRALGKLARIEQQEQILLTQAKYMGYSHAKKIKRKQEDVVEDMSLGDNQEDKPRNKKKKKRKRCFSNENSDTHIICEQAVSDEVPSDNVQNLKSNGDTIEINEFDNGRKSNKSNKQAFDEINTESSNGIVKKSKKKKKLKLDQSETEVTEIRNIEDVSDVPKKKKKKRNVVEEA